MQLLSSLSFLLFHSLLLGALGWRRFGTSSRKYASTRSGDKHMTLHAKHTLDGQEIDGDLQPVTNFCLVKVKESLEETAGGIFIPDNAKVKATQGTVIAIGPGRVHPNTAKLMDMVVDVGDKVMYGKYDGTELEYDGQTHQLIRDDDVLLTYAGNDVTLETAMPTKDNVLVKLPEKESNTVSGLVVSTTTDEGDISKRPDYGEVIRVGSGRQAGNGSKMEVQVQPGDHVRFRKYAGEEVKIERVKYLVVKCYDILAKI